ncbi:MAG: porin family protein [Bacteroidales bacterium]
MKKLLLILFFVVPVVANSQRKIVKNLPVHDNKALHFGFTLGLNSMDFRINHSEYAVENIFFAEVSSITPGFNINIVSNFRLSPSFDFRVLPGVAFGQRRIDYYTMDGPGLPGSEQWAEGAVPVADSYQDMESSFLEFPVVLKYKSIRINNYRPYVLGGINLRYDLAKNFNEDDRIYLDLKPFNIYMETGFGIDFYLPYFKLSTELKYATGFLDMLHRRVSSQTKFQDAIGSLKSNLIIFSLHFEE